MRSSADTCRTILHSRLVGLGVADEFSEIVDRQVLASGKQQWQLGDEAHGLKVGQRVIERPLLGCLVYRKGPVVAKHELITIRCGFGDMQGASCATRPSDIFDDQRLA